MTIRLAIVIQYWSQDRANAMRLARLIDRIETKPREDADIIFAQRFDAEDPDFVPANFALACYQSNTQWTGWPAGCNGVAGDVLRSLARHADELSGVLMLEPDCVPVAMDWLDRLLAAWNGRSPEVWQMGAWRPSGGSYGHINGCSILSLEAWSSIRDCFNQHLAWDCAIAPVLHDRWLKTPLIANEFESRNMEAIPEGAVLVHGCKDDSLYNLARERMGV